MHTPENPERSSATTRRSFLVRSSAAIVGASLAGKVAPARAGGRGGATLRVALVGCGGRGTGAAQQALSTAGDVRLVAVADAFSDRIERSLGQIREYVPPERIEVDEGRCFVGFDAYQKAIDSDADVVILATPPGFRPEHFAYAVARDKHVFMEKPVAVDAPGVRMVLAAAEEAKRKNLKVGVGLQRHHERKYQETVARIHQGAIGDPLLLRCYWNGGELWVELRQEGQSEMEYQMRNWYYFNWLCGDHIVEQHIHNIDVCNWILRGHPVQAQGTGGRQVRTGREYGEIYDHHMVEFTYADGAKVLSQCRQIPNCWNSVSEHAHGTQGTANVGAGQITSRGGWSWKFEGENPNPYQVEHDRLFRAIREDEPFNEAENGAIATMTAILGRMATYSGQSIRWEDALASELALGPERLAFDADPPILPGPDGHYPIPMPGATRVL